MDMLKTILSIVKFCIGCAFKNLIKSKPYELNKLNTEEKRKKLLFQSSFIQSWFARDFTLERWIQELQMLKGIGITEIILQSVVDTKNKTAVYPTEINGFSASGTDMVFLALEAGKETGVKVRIGTAESYYWWTKGWYNSGWFKEEAAINKTIVNEIFKRYSNHEAFGGWYIPYEFCELYAATKSQQKNLNLFFRSICDEIKYKSNLSIMIAPFYLSNRFKIGYSSSWSSILKNVLTGTGVDIVALQDSIGAGFNSVDDIEILFYYTKQATDELNITLFADIETFTAKRRENVSAGIERITMQMTKANPYIDGFIAFSIDHFQNKYLEEQKSCYEEYLDYFTQNV